MNPTSDHVDIAGYLVQMLTPEQKQRADEHIAACEECRTEVESMLEWTTALQSIPEEMLLDGPPEDADLLLQRTLRQIRVESSGQRRRRLAVVTGVAAAAVAVALAGGAVLGRTTAPAPVAQPSATASVVPGTRVASATDTATGARINVTVTPAAGWVRLTAAVAGIRAGERCRLEVVGRNGETVLAGSWLVSPAGAVNGTTLNGSALIDPAQVAAVRVVNTAGRQFVTVDV
jgi:hypothetical protein